MSKHLYTLCQSPYTPYVKALIHLMSKPLYTSCQSPYTPYVKALMHLMSKPLYTLCQSPYTPDDEFVDRHYLRKLFHNKTNMISVPSSSYNLDDHHIKACKTYLMRVSGINNPFYCVYHLQP